jgi:hypothetical protein
LFLAQDLLHSGRRHGNAEALQLAHNALIAPPRIFPCQANDQRSTLFGDRRTTRLPRVGPVLGHHPAVPTQECRRRDQKHRPIDTRQQLARRRQEPSIGRPKRRSTDVTTQDRHLMSEHDNLKLFGVRRSEQKRDKLQDPLQGNGNDGQEHGFSSGKSAILRKSN